MTAALTLVRTEGEGSRHLVSAEEALRVLARLEREIDEAPTLEHLDAISDAAAGLQRTFKPVKQVADKAGECWVAAEVRLGKELAKLPKAAGTKGQFLGGSNKEPPRTKTPDASAPTLAELGVRKKRASRARKLASISESKLDQYKEDLKSEDKAITPDALMRKAREEAKETKKEEVATAVFSEDGPFGCVVIDPPWEMEKIDRDVRPNQDAFAYRTMTEDQIEQWWNAEFSARLEPDCHLFMWTTNKHLPAALRLVEKFGFRYVLTMVWHKPGGFQPVGLPQYNCEFVVYARYGAPLFLDTKAFNCCFEAPRREHSRKPDLFYDTVRRVTGGSRIDVFSRERRDGFAQFGDEIHKFSEGV